MITPDGVPVDLWATGVAVVGELPLTVVVAEANWELVVEDAAALAVSPRMITFDDVPVDFWVTGVAVVGELPLTVVVAEAD
jgi:hypothetical protein